METADAPALFDSAFLSKLEQLYLLSRKLARGVNRAERPSRQIGASLEFADYRNYVLGDDLRTIDWNIYGRLDRLFIKLFEEEQDLHIHLLIDASASMRWVPSGSQTPQARIVSKFDQARRIAAALGYVGLANLDRVNVLWFDNGIIGDAGLTRGKGQFHKILDFLRRPPPDTDATNLLQAIRSFVQRTKRRGLAIVVSDFFDAHGFEEALATLQYNNFEAHVLQVLDPSEVNPDTTGDLRLTESETGQAMEITATPALLERYAEEFTAFQDKLTSYCRERGIGFAHASTHAPFEELVLKVLRDGYLLK